MTASPDCLGEEALIAFASGDAATPERAVWEQHLDSCGECRQLVSLLASHAHDDVERPRQLDLRQPGPHRSRRRS